MRVSGLSPTRVGVRLHGCRTAIAFLALAAIWGGWAASGLHAQQWRARAATRIQYVEGRTLVLDSVPVAQVAGSGPQRQFGEILVSCTPGAEYCYYYGSGDEISTVPTFVDLDLSVFDLGVEGLRFYASTRFRSALGAAEEKFWPRTDENVELLAAYAELNRPWFRVRLGRDWKVSGLGFYGYDGGSLVFRYRPARVELEAYGGWGLERGLPVRVTSDALESFGEFQPVDDNYLFGFRGSFGPFKGLAAEAVYQREIETDRSGITSERLALEASYRSPDNRWLVEGSGDYDLATGWWGKGNAKLGYWATRQVYLEGRLFRYRPVFSLQTIWVAFSPVAYRGWGLAAGLGPYKDVSARLELDRRDYSDAEAEVSYYATTERTWRGRVWVRWQPRLKWGLEGAFWREWGYGSALSSGNLKFNYLLFPDLTLGARVGAFQQIWEFRVGEGFVWNLGADARWRTRVGTLWAAVDGYRHDRKDDAALDDWTQLRAALGISYYLGSEPGRTP